MFHEGGLLRTKQTYIKRNRRKNCRSVAKATETDTLTVSQEEHQEMMECKIKQKALGMLFSLKCQHI